MIVMPQCGTNSSGEMPGRVTWIREGTTYRDVLTHELGHNLGLDHANSLICQMGKQRITQGARCSARSTATCGTPWASAPARTPCRAAAARVGGQGRHRHRVGHVEARDAEASGSGIQGVRVKVSNRVSYWLEYHTTDVASEKQPGSFEMTGTPGLQIRLDTGPKSMQILDAAPGNPDASSPSRTRTWSTRPCPRAAASPRRKGYASPWCRRTPAGRPSRSSATRRPPPRTRRRSRRRSGRRTPAW